MNYISRDKAFELLKKYNKDPFHIQHALTVEEVMKWYATEQGYAEEVQPFPYTTNFKRLHCFLLYKFY